MKPDRDAVFPASDDSPDLERDARTRREHGGRGGSGRPRPTLRGRMRGLAMEVREVDLPTRVVGAALVAGLAAVAVFGTLRAIARRRRRHGRTVRVSVGRSLIQELGARVLLGAAGVLGARLASDVLAPMMADQAFGPAEADLADAAEEADAAEAEGDERERPRRRSRR